MNEDAGWVAFVIFMVALICVMLITAIAVPSIEISRGVDHRSCTAFGQAANREVKFVEYTYFSWDCLTPTVDGKWISTTRLRDLDDD